jgi:hypothetical protein
MSDEQLARKLAELARAFPTPAVRLENHLLIFHAECGGMVGGELGKPLLCAECGKEMTAFVSAKEEAQLAHGKKRLRMPPLKNFARYIEERIPGSGGRTHLLLACGHATLGPNPDVPSQQYAVCPVCVESYQRRLAATKQP